MCEGPSVVILEAGILKKDKCLFLPKIRIRQAKFTLAYRYYCPFGNFGLGPMYQNTVSSDKKWGSVRILVL